MAIQLPFQDVSSWRVTPQNPVRFHNGFDFERCAALHNQLVEVGWTGSGNSLDDLERKTYFDYVHHTPEAENYRSRISDDLTAFLERAIVTKDDHSFFYCVNGLNHPHDLWATHEIENKDNGDDDRFLTLHAANNIASHPDGIVYVL